MAKLKNPVIGTGLITAIASSLCCITPVMAFIAGSSGMGSLFAWLEPFRLYLIGITVLVLGFAWYQKLRPHNQNEIQCGCEEDERPYFCQSKKFLGIVTVFAMLMMAFPYYAYALYPHNKKEVDVVNQANIQLLHLEIKGMTCSACDSHVTHAAHEIIGVIEAKADHTTGKAEIKFDKTKTNQEEIVEAINKTGYKVVEAKR